MAVEHALAMSATQASCVASVQTVSMSIQMMMDEWLANVSEAAVMLLSNNKTE